MFSTVPIT